MSEMFGKKFRGLVLAEPVENDSEFISIISDEEEEDMKKTELPDVLPILPLKNTVLFPGVIIPITVGREKSLKLIREVNKKSKLLGAVAQKDDKVDDPGYKDLNTIGALAQIVKVLEMPDGSTSVIIQGKKRFEMTELVSEEPYLRAKVKPLEDVKPVKDSKEFDAIIGSLKDVSYRIIKLSPHIPSEASFAIRNIESYVFLINFVSSNTDVRVAEKQKLLEMNDLKEREIL